LITKHLQLCGHKKLVDIIVAQTSDLYRSVSFYSCANHSPIKKSNNNVSVCIYYFTGASNAVIILFDLLSSSYLYCLVKIELIDLQVFINESEQVALYFLLFRIETGWLHCYAVNQKEQN